MYHEKLRTATQKNPWLNNHADLITEVNIVKESQTLIAVDRNSNYQKISAELNEDQTSTLLLNAIDKPLNIAFVQRQDGILPLGLFIDNTYQVL